MKSLFCRIPRKTYGIRFVRNFQLKKSSGIEIEKLQMSDVDDAYRFICDAFPLSHPYSWDRALGRSVTHLEQFVEPLLQETIESNWGSFGAWTNDRELVGSILLQEVFSSCDVHLEVELGEDRGEESDLPQSDFPPECHALIDKGYSIFKEEYSLRNKRNPIKYKLNSQCVVVGGIVVKEVMRGKGICSDLLNTGLDSIRMNGSNYALAFCISPISTRAFEKEGFEVWGAINYREFEFKGRRPFEILPDGMSIVVKEIG
jgi:predicted GNAT family acetyltransferase